MRLLRPCPALRTLADGCRAAVLAALLLGAATALAQAGGSGASADAHEAPRYDYVVAQDGSGDYTSIQAAIDGAKSFPYDRITIFVKDGVYDEKVVVHAWNPKISLIGESAEGTIITHGDYFDAIGRGRNSTFFTYTLLVEADDFYARNLTVRNTAGPVGQAVALHVEGDRAVFEHCRFLGNQDTVYAAGAGSRQYFKDCYIEGTVDFIFGGATAVFEDCEIHAKADSYITAASTPEREPYGFVFIDCRITTAPNVSEVYLGRPWRNFARTVFIGTEMAEGVHPAGWHNWGRPEAEATVFYAEHGSTGPGADRAQRVTWAHMLTAEKAEQYAPAVIFSAEPEGTEDAWYNRDGQALGRGVSDVTFVVAQDGSGDFETLQAAFDAVPAGHPGRVTVRLMDGVYDEKVLLAEGKTNVTLVGESRDGTIITHDDYSGKVVGGDTLGTNTSYTIAIDADGFTARDVTFENTYDGAQAVAVRVRGDRVAFHDVRMLGNQDTYYAKEGSSYHNDCYIEGTTDFIFGGATAVFEDCEIHAKADSYVTAASTPEEAAFGFVFIDCRLTAAPGVDEVYLGRPWRDHARTVFIDTEMGAHIRPEGWHNWGRPEAEQTAFYGEHGSMGPGAAPTARIGWAHALSADAAARYTPAVIFAIEPEGEGGAWYVPASERP